MIRLEDVHKVDGPGVKNITLVFNGLPSEQALGILAIQLYRWPEQEHGRGPNYFKEGRHYPEVLFAAIHTPVARDEVGSYGSKCPFSPTGYCDGYAYELKFLQQYFSTPDYERRIFRDFVEMLNDLETYFHEDIDIMSREEAKEAWAWLREGDVEDEDRLRKDD